MNKVADPIKISSINIASITMKFYCTRIVTHAAIFNIILASIPVLQVYMYKYFTFLNWWLNDIYFYAVEEYFLRGEAIAF